MPTCPEGANPALSWIISVRDLSVEIMTPTGQGNWERGKEVKKKEREKFMERGLNLME